MGGSLLSGSWRVSVVGVRVEAMGRGWGWGKAPPRRTGLVSRNNPQLAGGERASWRVGLGASGLESPINGKSWL